MKRLFTLLIAMVCLMSMQATTVTVAPNGELCNVTVDDMTFNDVPVTTVGDIHLLAINRDGVSLLVRYTDTATLVADGTVNGETVHYATEAATAYAKTFQIPYSDFEEWRSVGNSLEEPLAGWHGFGTCYTTSILYNSARTASKLSKDTHNGGHCAVIESKSVLGTVANGTMTTGRLQAGSASATNTANHSEMDITKTYTDNYAQYGPFYVLVKAKPDAIKTALKVVLKNASHKASLSAAITNGTYYQEPKDKTYTNVAATAGSTEIGNCEWSDFTYPFTYNDGVEAKAIMVTISTNASPGVGTSGDKVYIDDVELVYNAGISNIALDGVTVEGFNFDAATTDYTLYYSGTPQTITADNFVVTATGQSAIVVKNVEDMGNGNYRVAIGVTSPDFQNQALYTINITKRPVYILGEVNGKTWAPNDGVLMDTEDGTTYTATVTTEKEDGNYFSFTSELAIYNDEGSWSYIAPYRFGAELNGDGDFWITDALVGTTLNLGADGTSRAYRLEKGEWNLTVDLAARTLVVKQVKTVIPGDVDGSGTVDVADVNIVINIILGKSELSEYPNADFDGNGAVDVADVNAIINLILSK